MALGKRAWKAHVDIKRHMTDDPAQWRDVARGIAGTLEKAKRFADTTYAEELRDLADDPGATVEHLDWVLDAIYDFADAERIWLGTR